FGANYVITTASDYRAAGYVHGDRKKMIDEDMAQFARMGWDGIRLTFWGDWESSDSSGHLLQNDHLDLLDYLIAKARERGIYMLFSPIQLYGANWPDALADTTDPGFGRKYPKAKMGTDPAAIAAQVKYLKQILNHVNPYTGVALKDEPAILFVELVNEPWHHPEDLPGSIAYFNTLTDAVRSTGCQKLVFYNVSQDFRITQAIRKSKLQGVTFAWYPTGLNSGHELVGNYIRGVDAFPDMLNPDLAPLPRIVYEFDAPDTRTGYMYPAMMRTFRQVGAQFAAMFAYDMLQTASRNLGWQTHYLNLVYTPRKAMSAVIAAEAMHRLPRLGSYGPYPNNTRFGDFHVSYQENLGELVARDAFLYAGDTRDTPPDLPDLKRIAGYGSSPVVTYGGEGIYFLDKVKPGLWRLEVYPDAEPIRDPFEPPNPAKIVTRAINRPQSMTVTLPDLGATFTVQPVNAGAVEAQARGSQFTVTPGVYALSASGHVDPSAFPKTIGELGFSEYHAPPADTAPLAVQSLAPVALLAGHDAEVRARIVDVTPPDSATLFLRPSAAGFYRPFPMRVSSGYTYAATLPAGALAEGPHDFVITTYRHDSATTFPDAIAGKPYDWDYLGRTAWPIEVTGERTPVTLFRAADDASHLVFSRIGDAGRRGLFRVNLSVTTGAPVFHLELPVRPSGEPLPDYTASLVIKDRIVARGPSIAHADSVRVRARGLRALDVLQLTLMEDDGTSWTVGVPQDS
ncbi:MAG TPA: hypothetical protein VH163_08180, partial [Gemmatimonadales bacterium]|nr:hypothetical protein [Gemmatimonadales bacterium]